MLTLLRTAIRAFVIGFVAGVLFAPRSGAETRRMLREKFEALVNQVFELADLPPIRRGAEPASSRGTEPASSRGAEPAPSQGAAEPAPRRTRARRAQEPGAAPGA